MKKLLLILIFAAFSSSFAINQDSLFNIWLDKQQDDTTRITALATFINEGVLFSNPDSAHILSESLLNYSDKKNIITGKADALNFMGVSKILLGEYQQALGYFEKSLAISEKIRDKRRVSISLANIAVIYDNLGDYSKALEYNNKNIKYAEELGDKNALLRCYNNIGIIYDNIGNNTMALEYYNKCLKLSEEVGESRGILSSQMNIGLIFSDQKNYMKAKEYIRLSLENAEKIKDLSGVANAYNNLGYVYSEEGIYDKALEYYNNGLKKYVSLNEKKGVANSLFNIGELKLNQKLYKEALWYFDESVPLFKELELTLDLANNYNKKGLTYFGLNNINKSIQNCSKGLELAQEIGAIEIEKVSCECLYDSYKTSGNSVKALLFHERMLTLSDSIRSGETSKKLLIMEFENQLTADSLKKEKEKLLTKLDFQKKLSDENNLRNIAVGSGFLLLIIIGGLYIRMRYIRGSRAEAEYERSRSDNLLLNILPAEIAEELKEHGKSEARDFDNVTIMFTDFKEFTRISEKLGAKELVDEINTCFKFFDSVCEKYQIEKIKTIGDSFMAAGGIPIPHKESVKNTVLAAIEMSEYIKQRRLSADTENSHPFEMRVGISTGPVVAGIVGTKKFQYDIWGDTVNTASRMESSSEEGKVNVSRYTYDKLKDDPDLSFVPRGRIEVKGKGEIEMYFVELA